jgi:carboxypeptidase family protein/TonB-dependent receptor-like protein
MYSRCLCVTLLTLAGPLHAQADSVRAVLEGRVIDPAGTAIQAAEIIWQSDKRSVLSRADGSFALTVPVRGETVILVRRPGYSAQVLRVDLSTGAWRGRIVLVPGTQQLPDVEVAVRYAKPIQYSGTTKFDGFFRRQKLGIGTFVTREQIEKLNAFHTIEILRGIPGVYVSIGNPGDPSTADIRIPRCESLDHKLGKVTVWIDGQRLIEPGPYSPRGLYSKGSTDLAEMLERIAATGIEMVEVFRGPSQIPGEFHWDGCAAIVIWTRFNPTRRDTVP